MWQGYSLYLMEATLFALERALEMAVKSLGNKCEIHAKYSRNNSLECMRGSSEYRFFKWKCTLWEGV